MVTRHPNNPESGTTVSQQPALRIGAFGLALDAPAYPAQTLADLPDAPADWPLWRVVPEPWRGPVRIDAPDDLHAEVVTLPLSFGGALTIDRAQRQMALCVPSDQPAESVVHPWLSPAFALHVWWAGGLAVHAGAVAIDGRAWGVLGTKGSGKTTMLASLAQLDAAVMADDMVGLVGDEVLGGPGFVDLRHGAATQAFPDAVPLGRAGLRSRWRLRTGPAPAVAPLAGWFVLDWADEISVEEVRPIERLPLLAGALLVPITPRDPQVLLAQTTRPVLRLSRPRRFDALAASGQALIDAARRYG